MIYPNAQRRIDAHLQEGKQVGPLYHWASDPGTEMILRSNKFKGDPYVSFTRDKQFSFMKDGIWQKWRFTLDGDKIGEKHKIGPYSDYQRGYSRVGKRGSESEERVTLRKGETLGPLSKFAYLLEYFGTGDLNASVKAYVYYKKHGEEATMTKYGYHHQFSLGDDLYVARIVLAAKKRGIPVKKSTSL